MKVLVVCARRYNGHELWTALMVMQNEGVQFEVISTDTLIEDEVTHDLNTIERTIEQVPPEEVKSFDGLMIVSGNMADTELYWTHDRVQKYVKTADDEELAVAAICCSVPTVAPIASGKKVSFYPLVRSRARLLDHGALLQEVAVTVDDRLVTAEHQMATQMWAENFIDVLRSREPRHMLTPSTTVFNDHERMRKPIPELEDLKRRQYGITGPERCPDDGYYTTVRDKVLICPKCGKNWTGHEETHEEFWND